MDPTLPSFTTQPAPTTIEPPTEPPVTTEPAGDLYQHQPLDHTKSSIRILDVLPDDSPDGLLQCTLTQATVNAIYRCLSYTWGPPSPTQRIRVDGRIMVVRQNLWDFLVEVRRTGRRMDRWWIDAVCIDQSNTAERNHQVQQMGEIYSQAMQVVIWLGNAPGLAPILKIAEDRKERHNLSHICFQVGPLESMKRYLFDNPYWSRAWTTQEIGLASARFGIFVMCGGVTISYLTLLHDVSWKRSWPFPDNSMEKFAKQPRSLRGGRLMQLLQYFGSKDCTVPRDRIFSLLALCAEKDRFKVDYSMSDAEVMYMVLKQCGKDQLCFCTINLLARVLRTNHQFHLEEDVTSPSEQNRYPYIEVPVKTDVVFLDQRFTYGGRVLVIDQPSGRTAQNHDPEIWEMQSVDGNLFFTPYSLDRHAPDWVFSSPPRRGIADALLRPGAFAQGFELRWRDSALGQTSTSGYVGRTPRGQLTLRMPLLAWARRHREFHGFCDEVSARFSGYQDSFNPLSFNPLSADIRIGHTTNRTASGASGGG